MPVKRRKSSRSGKAAKRRVKGAAAKGGPNRPEGQEWVRKMVKWGKAVAKRVRELEQENGALQSQLAALKSGTPAGTPMMMMMIGQDPPPKPKDWP
jgi:hypothetical protein